MLGISMPVFGQHALPRIPHQSVEPGGVRSVQMSVPLKGEIGPQTMEADWQPVLTHLRVKHPRKSDEVMRKLKEEKTLHKFENETLRTEGVYKTGAAIIPALGTNFQGNQGTGSCPMDNTVAISNGGKIVSAINSNIAYYDQNGSLLYTSDLWSWFNDPSLANDICDPKVIYDSGADRFILYAQTCDAIAANSKVIIAFSQSNDPQNGWWLYQFTGNPLNDGSWFDYPKMGVSTDDLFVTGNLFFQSGGYNESVIYQMEKDDGYSGSSLSWQFWSGLDGDPFTILPVAWGQQGTVGPGALFVATDPGGSSNIDLFQISDRLAATNETIDHWNVSTTAYSPGGNAAQFGGGLLDTGDNRAMNGFYLDGVIHFVFHSDIGNGWNGINYNRLDINTLVNSSRMFGLQGTYDYCYPAVASFATSQTDKSVMIGFERSGSSIYPEYRVVNVDDAGNWSGSVRVKAGQSGISACGSPERWGDYTGISRRHNSGSPSVWISGAYANPNNYWGTWLSEIHSGGSVGRDEWVDAAPSSLYPNPVVDLFHVSFTHDKTEPIEVVILDVQGKKVKDLYQGYTTPGENVFTFNKGNLPGGIYFLQILSAQHQMLKNEKLIINR